jgi:hypothetical protein
MSRETDGVVYHRGEADADDMWDDTALVAACAPHILHVLLLLPTCPPPSLVQGERHAGAGARVHLNSVG